MRESSPMRNTIPISAPGMTAAVAVPIMTSVWCGICISPLNHVNCTNGEKNAIGLRIGKDVIPMQS